MNVSELWKAMEEEAGRACNQTWLMRLALPLPGCQLMAGFHVPSRSPAALLQLADGTELPVRQLPTCAGLDLRVTQLANKSYLEVRLKDPGCSDVFAVLIQDVVHEGFFQPPQNGHDLLFLVIQSFHTMVCIC